MVDFSPPDGFIEGDFLKNYRASRQAKRSAKYAHHRRKDFKPTPFLDLPRTQRRDLAASLNWRIRSDPNGQGVFTTHGILPGSREYPLFDEHGQRNISVWANFLFMAKAPLREGKFFNAMATSVLREAVERLEDLAEEAITERLSEEDKPNSGRRSFFQERSDGSTVTVLAPSVGLPSLDGLTKSGAQAAWLRERWDRLEELVSIQPHVELDFSYGHGIGVDFLVDMPFVDTETIPTLIKQFHQDGESARLEPPVDLTKYAQPLRDLMETVLWRWDADQARAEGSPEPDASPTVQRLYDFRSQGVRW